jgi:hypothetical protein
MVCAGDFFTNSSARPAPKTRPPPQKSYKVNKRFFGEKKRAKCKLADGSSKYLICSVSACLVESQLQIVSRQIESRRIGVAAF